MSFIKSVTRPVTMAALLGLTACGNQPSEGDIKKALTEQAGVLSLLGVRAEIVDVDKGQCADADEGRMRCTYKYTAKADGREMTQEDSAVFEKGASGDWKIVRR